MKKSLQDQVAELLPKLRNTLGRANDVGADRFDPVFLVAQLQAASDMLGKLLTELYAVAEDSAAGWDKCEERRKQYKKAKKKLAKMEQELADSRKFAKDHYKERMKVTGDYHRKAAEVRDLENRVYDAERVIRAAKEYMDGQASAHGGPYPLGKVEEYFSKYPSFTTMVTKEPDAAPSPDTSPEPDPEPVPAPERPKPQPVVSFNDEEPLQVDYRSMLKKIHASHHRVHPTHKDSAWLATARLITNALNAHVSIQKPKEPRT